MKIRITDYQINGPRIKLFYDGFSKLFYVHHVELLSVMATYHFEAELCRAVVTKQLPRKDDPGDRYVLDDEQLAWIKAVYERVEKGLFITIKLEV